MAIIGAEQLRRLHSLDNFKHFAVQQQFLEVYLYCSLAPRGAAALAVALMVARVHQAARGWEMLAVSRSCGVASCGVACGEDTALGSSRGYWNMGIRIASGHTVDRLLEHARKRTSARHVSGVLRQGIEDRAPLAQMYTRGITAVLRRFRSRDGDIGYDRCGSDWVPLCLPPMSLVQACNAGL
ncbi:hypothetical protein JKP88DRAFT_216234 [Tribonema minus]|uniref:Uncharacterized protein n=1 Tax=Tribonema minus TaxID=303371 RepID=A0A836C8U9_9STRA|nr:hypothetical protein JKP88DRAFT_216234 [Tribonema minus]